MSKRWCVVSQRMLVELLKSQGHCTIYNPESHKLWIFFYLCKYTPFRMQLNLLGALLVVKEIHVNVLRTMLKRGSSKWEVGPHRGASNCLRGGSVNGIIYYLSKGDHKLNVHDLVKEFV